MDIRFGKECCVRLLPSEMSTRDVVLEQVAMSENEGSDRHFYMCDLGQVMYRYQQWTKLMPRIKPYYAVKCNNDIPVLNVLSDLGAAFDCDNQIEINKVLDLGVSPSRIIYAQTCKQPSMLRYAEQKGVNLLTFDNTDELHKIKQIHETAKLVIRIAIDCADKESYDLDRKFGCHPSQTPSLLQTAKDLSLNVIGVSFHVGGNCGKEQTYATAIKHARYVFDIGLQLGLNMKLLDIGGGCPGEREAFETFRKIAATINQSIHEHFPPEEGVEVIAEPGRYMVCSTATVGVNIIARRVISSTPENKVSLIYMGSDSKQILVRIRGWAASAGSMLVANTQGDEQLSRCKDRIMYYVNDGVYGSFSSKLSTGKIYEPKMLKESQDADYVNSSIWGPTNDSMDAIIDSVKLPLHKIGEWLYFENMGSYTQALSSNFNGMEQPRRFYYCLADTWYTLYPKESSTKYSDGLVQGETI